MEGDKGLILRLMNARWPKTSIGAILLDRIEELATSKAISPAYGEIVVSLRGEGWSAESAETVLDEVIRRKVKR